VPAQQAPGSGKARQSDVRAYSRAKHLVERRFAFLIHLVVFLPIIAILWWLDLGMGTPNFPRWAWVATWAWGIGLATHFLATFLLADTRRRSPLAATLWERRRSFYLHLFAYVNSVILFWTLNLFGPPVLTDLGGGLFDTWAAWPTLFWGLAVFYHWFFTFVVRGWRVKKWKQAWTLRAMRTVKGFTPPDSSSGTSLE